MKKALRFIFLFPIELGIRLYKAIEKKLPKKARLWLNQQYLNWGARLLKHGSVFQPGQVVRGPRSKQPKIIRNMFYNFNQNCITYDYKAINGAKRKR